jgi:dTDP-4-amino-4,6-dideoxygalactose transaminase
MTTWKVDFYGHQRQYHDIKKEIDAAILAVLESGGYVQGPTLERFEGELAKYFGLKHAVGVNSGTDAIWLPLMALGIGAGDEVITTSNTFFATAEAIWIAGAKAVFVDIDPDTANIDPKLIEAAITKKTKAIIPVHLYGQCADMRAISKIAKKHNLRVIEDNAQGFGAAGADFKIGELSDAVATSFIIQKNLGTYGDGGAVITNNHDMTTRIKALRNHGSLERSVHSMGYNSRLDDLHAGILSVKLRYIDKWNDRRREIAKIYDKSLKGTSLKLPVEKKGFRHIYHLYVVETPKRDALQAFLKDREIRALTHYPICIHSQKGYPWGKDAMPNPKLPLSEKNAAQCLSLPMFPEMTQAEIDYTIQTILEWDCNQKG